MGSLISVVLCIVRADVFIRKCWTDARSTHGVMNFTHLFLSDTFSSAPSFKNLWQFDGILSQLEWKEFGFSVNGCGPVAGVIFLVFFPI